MSSLIRRHLLRHTQLFSKRSSRGTTRTFTTTPSPHADFTHAIIGAGAVGLSIARQLQLRSSSASPISTLLLEKHSSVGTETSSRNSEVIHAGLYYGKDTLKTKLCLRGKEMLYDLCESHRIPYKNCGKWIVAQDESQMGELEKVHKFAQEIGVPTNFISAEEAETREPEVSCKAGVLESPSTGIVDSHNYMQYLLGAFEEAGGDVAYKSEALRVEAVDKGRGGWRIWTSEEDSVTCETLINSAGLYAFHIQNMILPEEQHRKPYYAKGSYYSYSASTPKPSVLVYPAPVPGHGGLGTHLTIDMGGQVRFGPDVEWIDDPTDYKVSGKGFEKALDDIQAYLPGLKREEVGLGYAGIRPKLSKQSSVIHGKNFTDFVIEKPKGFEGFVNLVGIESPGLTSSLAIGEYVESMLYGDKKSPL
jgi:2-hydroxyglutarate dehydrogenase